MNRDKINLKPKKALRMGSLTVDIQTIQRQLELHERSMQRIKRNDPAAYRRLKAMGL